MASYERALQRLYQVPLAQFVAERERLVAELRAAGDGGAATDLAKRHRPTISAWTVNQLYWHARAAFDAMLAAAGRLRTGGPSGASDYREATATLRRRAGLMLTEAGHGATDAVLRRVMATLAAIAVAGGFDPDPPGALAADRDAPGFEAAGIGTGGRSREGRARAAGGGTDEVAAARARAVAKRERLEAAEADRRAAEQAEKKRREADRARRKAERDRAETRLRAVRAELGERERALAVVQKELRHAESAVGESHRAVRELERLLRELEDPS